MERRISTSDRVQGGLDPVSIILRSAAPKVGVYLQLIPTCSNRTVGNLRWLTHLLFVLSFSLHHLYISTDAIYYTALMSGKRLLALHKSIAFKQQVNGFIL